MRYRAIFLDMDGVLWRGERVIYENVEVVKRWEREGIKIIYLTNNSTRKREYHLEKLKGLGLNPEMEDILTSSFVTAIWLKNRGIKEVFVIGEEGLIHEISSYSIKIEDDVESLIRGSKNVDAVVVGMDRNISYTKLWTAQRCIERGSLFCVSNTDRTYPVHDGVAPGGGAIVAAIEASTSKSPDVIIGKPHPPIFEEALRRVSCSREEILVVGDRIDSDIEGAKGMGLDSLLVLTGITDREKIPLESCPNYIVKTLKEFSI
jgi:4-nitrophenyl phosphatase